MVHYLHARRDRMKTSSHLSGSQLVVHTVLSCGCEQTPLYLQMSSASKESRTAQIHKENPPSGRVLKINDISKVT
jgi:hypothetical protein